MPKLPIPINKGVYKNVDPSDLSGAESAAEFRNLMLNDAGSNVDRPALSQFARLGSFSVIGLTYFADTLVAVTSDRQVWAIDEDGVATNITGTALEGTSRPVFDDDGTYLSIAGGGAPKRWDGSGNTEALAGSPEACTHVVYLDGYWINFLLNDQELRIAGPTSVTRETWNSSDFFQAEGLPDNVNALAVLLRELHVFGPSSMEIFQNFGDATTPFQRSFFIDEGTIAPYSIIQADNTLWFLSSKRQIMFLNGRTPTHVSGPIDKVIRQFGTVSDCWASRIDIDGHYLLAWTFPAEERTFVYDYKIKEWYEWDGFLNGESDRLKIHSHAFVKEWNRHFVGDPTTGIIYSLSLSSKADGSNALRRVRRTGWYDHGTGVRKRSNHYLLHMKRGVGTLGSTEPVVQVRVNDDNKGWSEYKIIGLGYPGASTEPIRVKVGGIYRRRQLEILMTDAAEFSLSKIEEDVDLMTS